MTVTYEFSNYETSCNKDIFYNNSIAILIIWHLLPAGAAKWQPAGIVFTQ